MSRQGGGVPMWSVAVHWVHRLWGFSGSVGQSQPLPVFCPVLSCMSTKQSEMAATCAELEDLQAKPTCESRMAVFSARPGTT